MSDKLYHECYLRVCQTRRLLEDLNSWGYDSIASVKSEPQVISDFAHAVHPSLPQPAETLIDLQTGLQDCTRCGLCRQRKTVVFGRGNPHASLVFVGEAPGREEDLQGLPFVGEAGRLLEKIIHAMQLASDDVYICNVVKCRPPENRDPQADEVAACEPFLVRQLALIKPQIIVALGRFAAQTLLATTQPISKVRGRWHSYQGLPVMPTFHPAYLLRSPAEKKLVWEDMKQVMKRLQEGNL